MMTEKNEEGICESARIFGQWRLLGQKAGTFCWLMSLLMLILLIAFCFIQAPHSPYERRPFLANLLFVCVLILLAFCIMRILVDRSRMGRLLGEAKKEGIKEMRILGSSLCHPADGAVVLEEFKKRLRIDPNDLVYVTGLLNTLGQSRALHALPACLAYVVAFECM